MRWTPEGSGFDPGVITQRSAEMRAAFDVGHQRFVDYFSQCNPGIPFVLIPFGSVFAGVALEGDEANGINPSDFDCMIVYDNSSHPGTFFYRDLRKSSEIGEDIGIGSDVGFFTKNVEDFSLVAERLTQQSLFPATLLALFIIGDWYGTEEYISKMLVMRDRLIKAFDDSDGRNRWEMMKQHFKTSISEYSEKAGVDEICRRNRRIRALQELGLSYEQWQARRSARFPTI